MKISEKMIQTMIDNYNESSDQSLAEYLARQIERTQNTRRERIRQEELLCEEIQRHINNEGKIRLGIKNLQESCNHELVRHWTDFDENPKVGCRLCGKTL